VTDHTVAKEAVSERDELVHTVEAKLRELLQGVKDIEVLQELAEIADSAALEELVQRGKPPKWKKKASFSKPASGEMTFEAPPRRDSASQNVSSQFGSVSRSQIAVGGAGAGGGLGLNAPGFGPKVNHAVPLRDSMRTSSLKALALDDDIKRLWGRIQDLNDELSFIFCTYSADGKALEVKASGPGGLSKFKEQLGNDLAWGAFRCYGVDKRGGLECKRAKFVLVQYKPESASGMKKAKMGSNKGDVKDAMSGTHLDLVVEKLEDLDEQELITKLQAATGAHKPNGYEFTDGIFIDADFYGLGIGTDCKGETTKN